jgi:hypothetical protein
MPAAWYRRNLRRSPGVGRSTSRMDACTWFGPIGLRATRSWWSQPYGTRYTALRLHGRGPRFALVRLRRPRFADRHEHIGFISHRAACLCELHGARAVPGASRSRRRCTCTAVAAVSLCGVRHREGGASTRDYMCLRFQSERASDHWAPLRTEPGKIIGIPGGDNCCPGN